MPKYLSREDIVQKTQGFKTVEIEVPQWGGTLLIRELSAAEITALGSGIVAEDGQSLRVSNIGAIVDIMPQVCAWCVVDENLDQLLTVSDVQSMTGAQLEPISEIVMAVLEISDLKPDKAEESEDSDEEEGEDPNA